MSNVIHPSHYNIEGRKECIEEMIDVFGYEKTEHFCELNSYKYNYRHEQKNGQEDLDKAKNYEQMLSEISMRDPRWKIASYMGDIAQMHQLIEEMAELTQAICKYFRLLGEGQALAPNITGKDVMDNLVEEIADVKLVLDEVIYLWGMDAEVEKLISMKINRTLERLKAGGNNEER